MNARAAAVLLLGLAFGLAWSDPAAAEIYRCSGADGSLVFSDVPCADDAEIHRPDGALSVVAAAESLDAAAEANRDFIARRLAGLVEQRRAALQRERDQALRQRYEATVERNDAGIRSIRRLTWQPHDRRLADRQEAELRRQEQARNRDRATAQRRTLLSRSGGSRQRILD